MDFSVVASSTVLGALVGGFFAWLTMRAQKAPDLAESANETVKTIGDAYAATLDALKVQINMLTARIAAMDEHIEDLEDHIGGLTAALVKAGQPVPERKPRRRKPDACPASE